MPSRLACPLLLALALCSCGRDPTVQIIAGPYLIDLRPDAADLLWITSAPADTVVDSWTREPRRPVHVREHTRIHEAHLVGLAPDTLYHYQVRSGSARSGILEFRTPPAEARKFAFVVYGETAGQPEQHARLVEAMRQHDPAFVVHTGNLSSGTGGLEAWASEFFAPTRELLTRRPLVPAPGPRDRASRFYRSLFPSGGAGSWRSYRYRHVEVFSLDLSGSFAVGDEQYEWLARQCSRSPAQWRIAVFNPPLWSSGPSGGHGELRRALHPLLLRSRVDLTFCGGDPIYERSLPIGVGDKPEHNAIVHFVTGGGAAAKGPLRPGPWTGHAEATPHYLLVEVEGERLSVSARSPDGKVLDTVALRKAGTMRQRTGALSAEALEGLLAFLPREGFDLGPVGTQPVSRKFAVAIENPYDTPIEGNLLWRSANPAWRCEPAVLQVLVPPLGVQQLAFTATVRPPKLDPRPLCTFQAGGRRIDARHSPFRARVRTE